MPRELSDTNNLPPQAVLYLRVNNHGTRIHHTAMHAQRHACIRRANELGLAVAREYVEHVSDNRLEDRPELQRMLQELREPGRVSCVIVFDHARVAYTMQVYGQIVWALEQVGVRLETASHAHDAASSPDDSLMHLMATIGSRQHEADPKGDGNANQPTTGGIEK